MDYNFEEKIEFANVRQAKILRLRTLRDKAIQSFHQRFAADAATVALGFALKLSISGANLDRMVPMTIRGHNVSSETFKACVKPQRGQDVPETELTVSRFCASMADDISQYLIRHPDQVRTKVANIPPKLCFPHNYYVHDLDENERNQCIVWLEHHDQIMRAATRGAWRDLSLKAVAYFAAAGRSSTIDEEGMDV